ncbi:MAG: hypothetical protein ACRDT4_09695 [Micromonosporaceae bacterium]
MVSAAVLYAIDGAVLALCLGLPAGVLQTSVTSPGMEWYWRVVGILVGLVLLAVACSRTSGGSSVHPTVGTIVG